MIIRVSGEHIWFWCPGCDDVHGIVTGLGGWTWNGSFESPTFTPSVLVNGSRGVSSEEWNRKHPRCHSFVRDGRIQYLSDCEHELSNQTVPLGPLPAYLIKE